MKNICLIALLVLSTTSYCQVKVDTSIANRFNKAIADIDTGKKAKMQEIFDNMVQGEQSAGPMVFTLFKVDTLNKDQILKGTTFTYNSFSLVAGTMNLEHVNWSCVGYNDHDTLKINLPMSAFPCCFPDFYQKVIGKRVTATLEYFLADSALRLDEKQLRSGNLTIPVSVLHYSLSTLDYSVGSTIYGEAELLSHPYFIDNGGFKTGYIYQRIHCIFLFKLKVSKNDLGKDH
jgi:hypothetical protein